MKKKKNYLGPKISASGNASTNRWTTLNWDKPSSSTIELRLLNTCFGTSRSSFKSSEKNLTLRWISVLTSSRGPAMMRPRWWQTISSRCRRSSAPTTTSTIPNKKHSFRALAQAKRLISSSRYLHLSLIDFLSRCLVKLRLSLSSFNYSSLGFRLASYCKDKCFCIRSPSREPAGCSILA